MRHRTAQNPPYLKLLILFLEIAILNIAMDGFQDADGPGGGCSDDDGVETSSPLVLISPGATVFSEGMQSSPVTARFGEAVDWSVFESSDELDWSPDGASGQQTFQTLVSLVADPLDLEATRVVGTAEICASRPNSDQFCAFSQATVRIPSLRSDSRRTLSTQRPIETEVILDEAQGMPWTFEIVEVPSFVKVEQLSWDGSLAVLRVESNDESPPQCEGEPPCSQVASVRFRARLEGRTIERVVRYIVWVR